MTAHKLKDSGIGVDAKTKMETANGPKKRGLSAMALGCRMITAALAIDSEVAKGTRLTIGLPGPTPKAMR